MLFHAAICSVWFAHRNFAKLFLLLAFLVWSPEFCKAETARIDFLSQPFPAVFQDYFHMVIETSVHSEHASERADKVVNIRKYLIQIHLLPKGQTGKIDIVGPLNIATSTSSATTNDLQSAIREKDGSGTDLMPAFSWSMKGDLIKSVIVSENLMQRESLEMANEKAKWISIGTSEVLDVIPSSKTEEFFQSSSGQFVVGLNSDNKIRVYDTNSMKSLDDKWLYRVAADLFRRKDLGNSIITLTNDLQFLIVVPRFWSEATQFNVEKRAYSRETHGIVYERPTLTPRVFFQMQQDWGGGSRPLEPYSIDTSLRFLKYSDGELQLLDIDGKPVVAHQVGHKYRWLNDLTLRVHHDNAMNRFVFIVTPYWIKSPDTDKNRHLQGQKHVRLLFWDYKINRLQEYLLDPLSWFELKQNEFFPKVVVPIN